MKQKLILLILVVLLAISVTALAEVTTTEINSGKKENRDVYQQASLMFLQNYLVGDSE